MLSETRGVHNLMSVKENVEKQKYLGKNGLILFIAMPAAVIFGVGIALYQRIREIGKREVDDARKY